MEKDEIMGTLKGGLGIAGKLMGKGVDEVARALKPKDDGSDLFDTGLYFQPGEGTQLGLRTQVRFLEPQATSRGAMGLLKSLTTPGGEKLFAQACALLLQGDLSGSVSKLRETIAKDSQMTDAYFVLGSLLLEQDQPAEAIRHFNTALLCQQRLGKGIRKNLPSFGVNLWLTRRSVFCFFPDLVGLNILLSLSQRKAGKLEDASHTLDQLLKVVPADPVALFFLGLFRLEEGKPREAYELLREFLPDSNLHVANLLLLGLACSAMGDPVTSRELYRKALTKTDLDPMLRLDLRQALAETLAAEGWANDAQAERDAVAASDPS
ncbi:MAG: tetratricopeptide repeat protein, partial [Candidatus Eremiobacterota bacterium]